MPDEHRRIGLIADLHGNLIGLHAALAEIDRAGVDEIICLGDVSVLGPWPAEVIDTLIQRGIESVCGNVDAWVGEGTEIDTEPPTSQFTRTLTDWTRSRLDANQLEWLAGRPLTIERELGGFRIIFCHGSPASVDDIMVNLSVERVGEFGADVIVGGHTHQRTDRQIGDVRYLNPGSAGLPGIGPGHGLPVHGAPTWVEFAIVTITERAISFDPRRVPIDVDTLDDDATAARMPMLADWRALWGKSHV